MGRTSLPLLRGSAGSGAPPRLLRCESLQMLDPAPQSKLSSNEGYYAMVSILLVKIMLCSNLHCQRVLSLKVFHIRLGRTSLPLLRGSAGSGAPPRLLRCESPLIPNSTWKFQGLGLGSAGLRVGFRVQGPGSRVQGSGFRVQGSGFGFQGQEVVAVRIPADPELYLEISGFRVSGFGFRV